MDGWMDGWMDGREGRCGGSNRCIRLAGFWVAFDSNILFYFSSGVVHTIHKYSDIDTYVEGKRKEKKKKKRDDGGGAGQ